MNKEQHTTLTTLFKHVYAIAETQPQDLFEEMAAIAEQGLTILEAVKKSSDETQN